MRRLHGKIFCIKTELLKKPIKKIASYELNNLDDAINNIEINKSINKVINKVENSNNIINKDFVINRLKNVKVKYLERYKKWIYVLLL